MNSLNSFYPARVGIEFVVQRYYLHTGTALSSNDAHTLLDQFGARVRQVVGDIRQVTVRQSVGIEIAHLMTGRSMKGKTLGTAWQPGVWALSELHYIPQVFWTGEGILTKHAHRRS